MNVTKAERRISDDGYNCIYYINPENHYIKSYPFLLRATKLLCKEMGADSAIVISHIAYGWMPRILNYDFSNHNENILHLAQNVESFEEARGMIRKLESSPVNNSWVGLSKVLHFTNPIYFPIWDSKVAKQFDISEHYQMKQRHNYVNYISFIESQLERNIVSEVQKEFKIRTNYEVSKVRACEFILFSI